jgi:hypothetical protein
MRMLSNNKTENILIRTRQSLMSQSHIMGGNDERIMDSFHEIIEQCPDLSVPVAVIKTLIKHISSSKGSECVEVVFVYI